MMKNKTSDKDIEYAADFVETPGFAESTTIHGIAEISRAKNPAVKLIWVCIFLLSLSGMTVELYSTFQQFTEEPTASVVSFTFPRQWPPIVICPPSWVDLDRAAAVGFDARMLHYVRMMLWNSQEYAYELNMTGTEVDETKHKLQVLVNKYGNLDAVLREVSFAPEKIATFINPWDISAELKTNTTQLPTTIGMCFKYDTNNFYEELDVVGAMKTRRIIQLFYRNDFPEMKYFYEIPIAFAMGDMANTNYPTGDIKLRPNAHYFVKATYKHSTRANLRRAPCRPYSEKEKMVELLNCFNDYCSALGCVQYAPGQDQKNVSAVCTEFNTEPSCLTDGRFKEMTQHCAVSTHPPCDLSRFILVGMPYDNGKSDVSHGDQSRTAFLTLSFSDPANSEVIVESEVYSMNTMISNVGGIISLWCGASMLSLAQMAYYSTSCCKKGRKQRH